VVPDPRDTKFGRLLGKSIRYLDLAPDFQHLGRPDHRSQHAYDAGMRRLFQRLAILGCSPDFHGNPHHDARALPALFKL